MDQDFVWNLSIPSNVLICGPSGSGKSTFVQKLIDTPAIWAEPIDNLWLCYGIYSENVKEFSKKYPQARLIEDLPRNLDQPMQIFNPNQRNVIIFDDLGSESQASPVFTNFMTRGSHHCNVCILSLEHHLFSEAKERRKQTHHWHTVILFRNKRGLHQIGTLARQTAVGTPRMVQHAFRDATKIPYGYLVIDFRNETPDEMRLLTNVLCENSEPTYCYLENY
jgi:DNA polymerase III delta prime subunit